MKNGTQFMVGSRRLLSRREVARWLDVSVVTLWRMVCAQQFPRPMRISPGRVGWPEHIVVRWIDEHSDETRVD